MYESVLLVNPGNDTTFLWCTKIIGPDRGCMYSMYIHHVSVLTFTNETYSRPNLQKIKKITCLCIVTTLYLLNWLRKFAGLSSSASMSAWDPEQTTHTESHIGRNLVHLKQQFTWMFRTLMEKNGFLIFQEAILTPEPQTQRLHSILLASDNNVQYYCRQEGMEKYSNA